MKAPAEVKPKRELNFGGLDFYVLAVVSHGGFKLYSNR